MKHKNAVCEKKKKFQKIQNISKFPKFNLIWITLCYKKLRTVVIRLKGIYGMNVYRKQF